MYNIRLDHPLTLLTVCPPGCSLVEEMYTSSDVEEILDGLKKVVRVGDHLVRRYAHMETAAQKLRHAIETGKLSLGAIQESQHERPNSQADI